MIKRSIKLYKRNINYTLKRSMRARRMRLAVYCDGNFVVTAPRNVGDNIIDQFITKKSQWIIEKLEYFKGISGKVFHKDIEKDYLACRDEALAIVQKRIEYFNGIYGFQFNKINIKSQKTRWGSCSRKGNLNFNYKIVLLPEKLADYIIVHELCHLKEFNHSQKFWNLVARSLSDYSEIRKELNEVGRKFI